MTLTDYSCEYTTHRTAPVHHDGKPLISVTVISIHNAFEETPTSSCPTQSHREVAQGDAMCREKERRLTALTTETTSELDVLGLCALLVEGQRGSE